MGYNEALAESVRKILRRRRGITERKMFGGVAFLLHGNMCCGVTDDKVVLRLGSELAAEALKQPHVEPMDFTGKPMDSMVYLTRKGSKHDEDLKAWIDKAFQFAKGLPRK
jgi:TfoX/Sxy family transcriptional regulator of competence genes